LVAASVAVTVIVCVQATSVPLPVTAQSDPLVPLQLRSRSRRQYIRTTARQLVPALTLVGAGQSRRHCRVMTVNVVVQVALLSPHRSPSP